MNPLFHFEPYSGEFARDPYPAYARMRRECPVYYHEKLGCLVVLQV